LEIVKAGMRKRNYDKLGLGGKGTFYFPETGGREKGWDSTQKRQTGKELGKKRGLS